MPTKIRVNEKFIDVHSEKNSRATAARGGKRLYEQFREAENAIGRSINATDQTRAKSQTSPTLKKLEKLVYIETFLLIFSSINQTLSHQRRLSIERPKTCLVSAS